MLLDSLILSFVDVTEEAAIASSELTGSGDRKGADHLATEAMRKTFQTVAIDGVIVIGEGERDEAPMLYIGEKVGQGGMAVDIAVDPLEGTNLCAMNKPGAITVIGIGHQGSLMHAPDTYMDKLVVGTEVKEKVSLSFPTEKNLQIIAKGYGIEMKDLNIVVMERERNKKLIGEIRPLGDASRDYERLENLKAMCELHAEIHRAIDDIVYEFKDDKRGTVKMCRDFASKYIDSLGIPE